ncbi:uncharacterized protein LOC130751515 [Actinidia eriantha]|uniref:uncharacterized protein LOC130751515 n=1 Tax=Actinidia eriantha TaxID=165200 RepID=UPI002589A09B|nr:uncharacterized protein LOC130751515 [Actinidia eriantha]
MTPKQTRLARCVEQRLKKQSICSSNATLFDSDFLFLLLFIVVQAILQFFLDFGELVLHDADPSLRIFFLSCLSREFADPVVPETTLEFPNLNKRKLVTSYPTLLPQLFPLMLKLIAWNGEKLEKSFFVPSIGVSWVISSAIPISCRLTNSL